MPAASSPDAFTIERHGEVIAILTSPILETMEPSQLEGASALLREALKKEASPLIVVDLSPLDYFGSSFLAVLIQCWKLATTKNGEMALSGVSPRTRELLHMTSLDMVWPMYDDLRQAIEALSAD